MMMSSRTDTLSGKDVTSGSQSNAVAARQTKESDPEELQAKVQKLAKAARTLQHNLALRTGQVGDLKKQNAALFAENDTLKQRVTQLENLLAAAQQQSAPGRQAEHRRSMSFRVPQRSSGGAAGAQFIVSGQDSEQESVSLSQAGASQALSRGGSFRRSQDLKLRRVVSTGGANGSSNPNVAAATAAAAAAITASAAVRRSVTMRRSGTLSRGAGVQLSGSPFIIARTQPRVSSQSGAAPTPPPGSSGPSPRPSSGLTSPEAHKSSATLFEQDAQTPSHDRVDAGGAAAASGGSARGSNRLGTRIKALFGLSGRKRNANSSIVSNHNQALQLAGDSGGADGMEGQLQRRITASPNDKTMMVPEHEHPAAAAPQQLPGSEMVAVAPLSPVSSIEPHPQEVADASATAPAAVPAPTSHAQVVTVPPSSMPVPGRPDASPTVAGPLGRHMERLRMRRAQEEEIRRQMHQHQHQLQQQQLAFEAAQKQAAEQGMGEPVGEGQPATSGPNADPAAAALALLQEQWRILQTALAQKPGEASLTAPSLGITSRGPHASGVQPSAALGSEQTGDSATDAPTFDPTAIPPSLAPLLAQLRKSSSLGGRAHGLRGSRYGLPRSTSMQPGSAATSAAAALAAAGTSGGGGAVPVAAEAGPSGSSAAEVGAPGAETGGSGRSLLPSLSLGPSLHRPLSSWGSDLASAMGDFSSRGGSNAGSHNAGSNGGSNPPTSQAPSQAGAGFLFNTRGHPSAPQDTALCSSLSASKGFPQGGDLSLAAAAAAGAGRGAFPQVPDSRRVMLPGLRASKASDPTLDVILSHLRTPALVAQGASGSQPLHSLPPSGASSRASAAGVAQAVLAATDPVAGAQHQRSKSHAEPLGNWASVGPSSSGLQDLTLPASAPQSGMMAGRASTHASPAAERVRAMSCMASPTPTPERSTVQAVHEAGSQAQHTVQLQQVRGEVEGGDDWDDMVMYEATVRTSIIQRFVTFSEQQHALQEQHTQEEGVAAPTGGNTTGAGLATAPALGSATAVGPEQVGSVCPNADAARGAVSDGGAASPFKGTLGICDGGASPVPKDRSINAASLRAPAPSGSPVPASSAVLQEGADVNADSLVMYEATLHASVGARWAAALQQAGEPEHAEAGQASLDNIHVPASGERHGAGDDASPWIHSSTHQLDAPAGGAAAAHDSTHQAQHVAGGSPHLQEKPSLTDGNELMRTHSGVLPSVLSSQRLASECGSNGSPASPTSSSLTGLAAGRMTTHARQLQGPSRRHLPSHLQEPLAAGSSSTTPAKEQVKLGTALTSPAPETGHTPGAGSLLQQAQQHQQHSPAPVLPKKVRAGPAISTTSHSSSDGATPAVKQGPHGSISAAGAPGSGERVVHVHRRAADANTNWGNTSEQEGQEPLQALGVSTERAPVVPRVEGLQQQISATPDMPDTSMEAAVPVEDTVPPLLPAAAPGLLASQELLAGASGRRGPLKAAGSPSMRTSDASWGDGDGDIGAAVRSNRGSASTIASTGSSALKECRSADHAQPCASKGPSVGANPFLPATSPAARGTREPSSLEHSPSTAECQVLPSTTPPTPAAPAPQRQEPTQGKPCVTALGDGDEGCAAEEQLAEAEEGDEEECRRGDPEQECEDEDGEEHEEGSEEEQGCEEEESEEGEDVDEGLPEEELVQVQALSRNLLQPRSSGSDGSSSEPHLVSSQGHSDSDGMFSGPPVVSTASPGPCSPIALSRQLTSPTMHSALSVQPSVQTVHSVTPCVTPAPCTANVLAATTPAGSMTAAPATTACAAEERSKVQELGALPAPSMHAGDAEEQTPNSKGLGCQGSPEASAICDPTPAPALTLPSPAVAHPQQQQHAASPRHGTGAELAAAATPTNDSAISRAPPSASTDASASSPAWSDAAAAVYDVTPAPATKTAQVYTLHSSGALSPEPTQHASQQPPHTPASVNTNTVPASSPASSATRPSALSFWLQREQSQGPSKAAGAAISPALSRATAGRPMPGSAMSKAASKGPSNSPASVWSQRQPQDACQPLEEHSSRPTLQDVNISETAHAMVEAATAAAPTGTKTPSTPPGKALGMQSQLNHDASCGQEEQLQAFRPQTAQVSCGAGVHEAVAVTREKVGQAPTQEADLGMRAGDWGVQHMSSSSESGSSGCRSGDSVHSNADQTTATSVQQSPEALLQDLYKGPSVSGDTDASSDCGKSELPPTDACPASGQVSEHKSASPCISHSSQDGTESDDAAGSEEGEEEEEVASASDSVTEQGPGAADSDEEASPADQQPTAQPSSSEAATSAAAHVSAPTSPAASAVQPLSSPAGDSSPAAVAVDPTIHEHSPHGSAARVKPNVSSPPASTHTPSCPSAQHSGTKSSTPQSRRRSSTGSLSSGHRELLDAMRSGGYRQLIGQSLRQRYSAAGGSCPGSAEPPARRVVSSLAGHMSQYPLPDAHLREQGRRVSKSADGALPVHRLQLHHPLAELTRAADRSGHYSPQGSQGIGGQQSTDDEDHAESEGQPLSRTSAEHKAAAPTTPSSSGASSSARGRSTAHSTGDAPSSEAVGEQAAAASVSSSTQSGQLLHQLHEDPGTDESSAPSTSSSPDPAEKQPASEAAMPVDTVVPACSETGSSPATVPSQSAAGRQMPSSNDSSPSQQAVSPVDEEEKAADLHPCISPAAAVTRLPPVSCCSTPMPPLEVGTPSTSPHTSAGATTPTGSTVAGDVPAPAACERPQAAARKLSYEPDVSEGQEGSTAQAASAGLGQLPDVFPDSRHTTGTSSQSRSNADLEDGTGSPCGASSPSQATSTGSDSQSSSSSSGRSSGSGLNSMVRGMAIFDPANVLDSPAVRAVARLPLPQTPAHASRNNSLLLALAEGATPRGAARSLVGTPRQHLVHSSVRESVVALAGTGPSDLQQAEDEATPSELCHPVDDGSPHVERHSVDSGSPHVERAAALAEAASPPVHHQHTTPDVGSQHGTASLLRRAVSPALSSTASSRGDASSTGAHSTPSGGQHRAGSATPGREGSEQDLFNSGACDSQQDDSEEGCGSSCPSPDISTGADIHNQEQHQTSGSSALTPTSSKGRCTGNSPRFALLQQQQHRGSNGCQETHDVLTDHAEASVDDIPQASSPCLSHAGSVCSDGSSLGSGLVSGNIYGVLGAEGGSGGDQLMGAHDLRSSIRMGRGRDQSPLHGQLRHSLLGPSLAQAPVLLVHHNALYSSKDKQENTATSNAAPEAPAVSGSPSGQASVGGGAFQREHVQDLDQQSEHAQWEHTQQSPVVQEDEDEEHESSSKAQSTPLAPVCVEVSIGGQLCSPPAEETSQSLGRASSTSGADVEVTSPLGSALKAAQSATGSTGSSAHSEDAAPGADCTPDQCLSPAASAEHTAVAGSIGGDGSGSVSPALPVPPAAAAHHPVLSHTTDAAPVAAAPPAAAHEHPVTTPAALPLSTHATAPRSTASPAAQSPYVLQLPLPPTGSNLTPATTIVAAEVTPATSIGGLLSGFWRSAWAAAGSVATTPAAAATPCIEQNTTGVVRGVPASILTTSNQSAGAQDAELQTTDADPQQNNDTAALERRATSDHADVSIPATPTPASHTDAGTPVRHRQEALVGNVSAQDDELVQLQGIQQGSPQQQGLQTEAASPASAAGDGDDGVLLNEERSTSESPAASYNLTPVGAGGWAAVVGQHVISRRTATGSPEHSSAGGGRKEHPRAQEAESLASTPVTGGCHLPAGTPVAAAMTQPAPNAVVCHTPATGVQPAAKTPGSCAGSSRGSSEARTPSSRSRSSNKTAGNAEESSAPESGLDAGAGHESGASSASSPGHLPCTPEVNWSAVRPPPNRFLLLAAEDDLEEGAGDDGEEEEGGVSQQGEGQDESGDDKETNSEGGDVAMDDATDCDSTEGSSRVDSRAASPQGAAQAEQSNSMDVEARGIPDVRLPAATPEVPASPQGSCLSLPDSLGAASDLPLQASPANSTEGHDLGAPVLGSPSSPPEQASTADASACSSHPRVSQSQCTSPVQQYDLSTPIPGTYRFHEGDSPQGTGQESTACSSAREDGQAEVSSQLERHAPRRPSAAIAAAGHTSSTGTGEQGVQECDSSTHTPHTSQHPTPSFIFRSVAQGDSAGALHEVCQHSQQLSPPSQVTHRQLSSGRARTRPRTSMAGTSALYSSIPSSLTKRQRTSGPALAEAPMQTPVPTEEHLHQGSEPTQAASAGQSGQGAASNGDRAEAMVPAAGSATPTSRSYTTDNPASAAAPPAQPLPASEAGQEVTPDSTPAASCASANSTGGAQAARTTGSQRGDNPGTPGSAYGYSEDGDNEDLRRGQDNNSQWPTWDAEASSGTTGSGPSGRRKRTRGSSSPPPPELPGASLEQLQAVEGAPEWSEVEGQHSSSTGDRSSNGAPGAPPFQRGRGGTRSAGPGPAPSTGFSSGTGPGVRDSEEVTSGLTAHTRGATRPGTRNVLPHQQVPTTGPWQPGPLARRRAAGRLAAAQSAATVVFTGAQQGGSPGAEFKLAGAAAATGPSAAARGSGQPDFSAGAGVGDSTGSGRALRKSGSGSHRRGASSRVLRWAAHMVGGTTSSTSASKSRALGKLQLVQPSGASDGNLVGPGSDSSYRPGASSAHMPGYMAAASVAAGPGTAAGDGTHGSASGPLPVWQSTAASATFTVGPLAGRLGATGARLAEPIPLQCGGPSTAHQQVAQEGVIGSRRPDASTAAAAEHPGQLGHDQRHQQPQWLFASASSIGQGEGYMLGRASSGLVAAVPKGKHGEGDAGMPRSDSTMSYTSGPPSSDPHQQHRNLQHNHNHSSSGGSGAFNLRSASTVVPPAPGAGGPPTTAPGTPSRLGVVSHHHHLLQQQPSGPLQSQLNRGHSSSSATARVLGTPAAAVGHVHHLQLQAQQGLLVGTGSGQLASATSSPSKPVVGHSGNAVEAQQQQQPQRVQSGNGINATQNQQGPSTSTSSSISGLGALIGGVGAFLGQGLVGPLTAARRQAGLAAIAPIIPLFPQQPRAAAPPAPPAAPAGVPQQKPAGAQQEQVSAVPMSVPAGSAGQDVGGQGIAMPQAATTLNEAVHRATQAVQVEDRDPASWSDSEAHSCRDDTSQGTGGNNSGVSRDSTHHGNEGDEEDDEEGWASAESPVGSRRSSCAGSVASGGYTTPSQMPASRRPTPREL